MKIEYVVTLTVAYVMGLVAYVKECMYWMNQKGDVEYYLGTAGIFIAFLVTTAVARFVAKRIKSQSTETENTKEK